MKKKLNPEQAAARDARRANFRHLVKQVASMSDAARHAMILNAGAVITCEGRALSVANTILTMLQLPGVSMVGGFRQWIRQGRCVRKGQHGAQICIPLGARTDEAGEVSGVKFGCATVFDISQTDVMTPGTAVVGAEIADAFNMRGLPNTIIDEEPLEETA